VANRRLIIKLTASSCKCSLVYPIKPLAQSISPNHLPKPDIKNFFPESDFLKAASGRPFLESNRAAYALPRGQVMLTRNGTFDLAHWFNSVSAP